MGRNVLDIKDTNMALFGSDLEKKVKEAAAGLEPAWVGCEAAPDGHRVKVWRIEQFVVKPWEEVGEFLDGDSYIMLHSYTVEGKDAVYHDIHFWLGQYTTADEAGTAAYKTVELDDYLGGVAVQYREVQGLESERFGDALKAVGKKYKVLNGGIASGFRTVTKEEVPKRMFVVSKIGKNVKISQVPFSKQSLRSDDVFIIDLGESLVQWNGSACAVFEKSAAMAECMRIQEEEDRAGARHVVVEEGEDSELISQLPDESVESFEREAITSEGGAKLLRVHEEGGEIQMDEVDAGAKLNRSKLASDDVFVADGGARLFVWVGGKASPMEKASGLKYARKYLRESGRPAALPIVKIPEHREPREFDALFG